MEILCFYGTEVYFYRFGEQQIFNLIAMWGGTPIKGISRTKIEGTCNFSTNSS